MTLDDLLTVLITALVYACVVALLASNVFAGLYAIVHAWRRDRIGWSIVLAIPFLTGGGIATAVYLFVHAGEPMPTAPSRRRALA